MAIVAWGSSAVLGKGLELDPLAIVFWRLWLAALWMLGVMWLRGRRLTWAVLRLCIWGGIAFAADLMLFFTAVKATTVANATVISSMQPVVMLFVAPRVFGERIHGRDIGWASVAIVGMVVVVFGATGLPAWSPRGDLLAVAVLVAWTGYSIASKKAQRFIGATEYTTGSALVAAITVTPFVLLSGQDLSLPSGRQWIGLVVLALVVGWAGHQLWNVSLARIPIWLASSLGLGIPVASTAMAAIFLDEQTTVLQLAGMAVVIGSLVIMTIQGSGTERAVPGDDPTDLPISDRT